MCEAHRQSAKEGLNGSTWISPRMPPVTLSRLHLEPQTDRLMRSSKSRSRNKSNRQRSLGNVVNRVFDSSGPEGKVRGTPQQIIEKYLNLARDAQLSNDRVAEQSFLQHAEHYTRLLGEAQREMADRQAQFQQQQNQQQQNQPPQNQQRQSNDDDRNGEDRNAGPRDTGRVHKPQEPNVTQEAGSAAQPDRDLTDGKTNGEVKPEEKPRSTTRRARTKPADIPAPPSEAKPEDVAEPLQMGLPDAVATKEGSGGPVEFPEAKKTTRARTTRTAKPSAEKSSARKPATSTRKRKTVSDPEVKPATDSTTDTGEQS